MKILLNNSLCILFSVIMLMFVPVVSAQNQTEKEIVKIRAEVAAINKDVSKYAKITKNVEDVSLEGTEATYYRSAKILKKISAKIFGETYNQTGEFYYQNGELIFAFVKRNQYDTQIGLDTPAKVVSSEERRFYFVGGKLIRLLIGKKELKFGEKYSELKNELVTVSSKLKDS